MSVHRDSASGTRSVSVETDVPGNLDEVWRAVATGPGIGAWFLPTEVTEREGGTIVFDMGPSMGTSTGVITAWEPPRRLAYEEREWMPGAPPVATELTVEARAGGTCRVRMAHSLAADSDDWDEHLESFEEGWPPFFHVLEGYLTHFAGERCSQVQAAGSLTGTVDEAWSALTGAFGLPEPREGARVRAAAGPPALSGVVEWAKDEAGQRGVVVRTEEPAPGFALLGAFAWGGLSHTTLTLYLYGEEGEAAAGRATDPWRAWMAEHFPAGAGSES